MGCKIKKIKIYLEYEYQYFCFVKTKAIDSDPHGAVFIFPSWIRIQEGKIYKSTTEKMQENWGESKI